MTFPPNPFIRAYDNFVGFQARFQRGWECEGRVLCGAWTRKSCDYATAERFSFAFGFVLYWVCGAGIVVSCYLAVSKVIDVSFAHLTLRMLFNALAEVVIGVYVFRFKGQQILRLPSRPSLLFNSSGWRRR